MRNYRFFVSAFSTYYHLRHAALWYLRPDHASLDIVFQDLLASV